MIIEFISNLRFYQIVVVLVSVTMLYFGLEKYLRRQPNQSLFKLSARFLVWGGMALVALFPMFTNYIARFIGLEGNINAVILIGFLMVFLMIFKILSVVERIEQDISTLTRRDALKRLPGPKK